MLVVAQKAPDWLKRRFCFIIANAELEHLSKHLREKISHNSAAADIDAIARGRLEHQIGLFPSEDDPETYDTPEDAAFMEGQMQQALEDIIEGIKDAESYSWGLAIAGVYHLWERQTRIIVADIKPLPNISRIEKASFLEICKIVESTRYNIFRFSSYTSLEIASQVSNSIKHGPGSAYRSLQKNRPDLFIIT